MPFCHQCGQELPDVARFCPGCGSPRLGASGADQAAGPAHQPVTPPAPVPRVPGDAGGAVRPTPATSATPDWVGAEVKHSLTATWRVWRDGGVVCLAIAAPVVLLALLAAGQGREPAAWVLLVPVAVTLLLPWALTSSLGAWTGLTAAVPFGPQVALLYSLPASLVTLALWDRLRREGARLATLEPAGDGRRMAGRVGIFAVTMGGTAAALAVLHVLLMAIVLAAAGAVLAQQMPFGINPIAAANPQLWVSPHGAAALAAGWAGLIAGAAAYHQWSLGGTVSPVAERWSLAAQHGVRGAAWLLVAGLGVTLVRALVAAGAAPDASARDSAFFGLLLTFALAAPSAAGVGLALLCGDTVRIGSSALPGIVVNALALGGATPAAMLLRLGLVVALLYHTHARFGLAYRRRWQSRPQLADHVRVAGAAVVACLLVVWASQYRASGSWGGQSLDGSIGVSYLRLVASLFLANLLGAALAGGRLAFAGDDELPELRWRAWFLAQTDQRQTTVYAAVAALTVLLMAMMLSQPHRRHHGRHTEPPPAAATPPPPAAAPAPDEDCAARLRQLSRALMLYAQDYDEHLPPARPALPEVLYPYTHDAALWRCPAAVRVPSYALPAALADRPLSTLRRRSETPWLFESDDGSSLARRHAGGANYAFADGHVGHRADDPLGSLPALLSTPPAPSLPPPATIANQTVTVANPKTSYMNLRVRPDAEAPVVGKANNGTAVRVLEQQGDWARVQVPGGRAGWMRWRLSSGLELVRRGGAPASSPPPPAAARLGGSGFARGQRAVYRDRERQPLKLRDAPSSGAAVVASLPYEAQLKVLEQRGDWLRVEVNGRQGWCAWRRPGGGPEYRYLHPTE